ncbi:MAG: hypothetical protein A2583_10260 [Bdellovibrionales bacterium RIFOXYD1_FULL_53_11]|nr:MAG: hypothetical protein A2583_10260 [Bdellovibrionales bacterium RIFOXYD1_FULL_53_11]
MDRPVKTQFDLKTVMVAAICLAGVAGGSYMLYRDINATGRAGVGKPLVTVERKQAKVRRKAAGSYVWSNIEARSGLYRKDAIQTGSGSAAALKFEDGALLELSENSLVVIDDISNLALGTMQGSFIVRTKDGDRQISVGSDGKARVVTFPVRLVRPETLSVFYVPEKGRKDVRFAWQIRTEPASPALGRLLLQISSTKSFPVSGTRTVELPAGAAGEVREQLAGGRHFWRIVSREGGNQEALSQPSEFEVAEAAALRPVWPAGNKKIAMYERAGAVQFRWIAPENEDAEGGRHEIQVAGDASFSKIALSMPVEAGAASAMIEGLGFGDYHWRVRSRYGDISVASPAERFTVEKARAVAVELVYPEDGGSVEFRGGARLSWNCEVSGAEYLVEVAGPDGKTVELPRQKAGSLVMKDARMGAYKWKVSAFVGGQKAGESEPRAFSLYKTPLVLRAPANDEKIEFWDKPPGYEFKWESDEAVEKSGAVYKLEIAKDGLFKTPIVVRTLSAAVLPSDRIKLEQGTLFWRVSVVDQAGRLVKTSNVAKFLYRMHPELPAPEAVSPGVGSVFNLMEKPVPVLASWIEVKGAEKYEVVLVRAGDIEQDAGRAPAATGTKIIAKLQTNEAQHEFADLGPGRYVLTVRAIDRLGRPGAPSSPRQFGVTFGEVLAPPEIISPEVQ